MTMSLMTTGIQTLPIQKQYLLRDNAPSLLDIERLYNDHIKTTCTIAFGKAYVGITFFQHNIWQLRRLWPGPHQHPLICDKILQPLPRSCTLTSHSGETNVAVILQ